MKKMVLKLKLLFNTQIVIMKVFSLLSTTFLLEMAELMKLDSRQPSQEYLMTMLEIEICLKKKMQISLETILGKE